MVNRARKPSSLKKQKQERRKILRIIAVLLGFFLLYNLITEVFFSVYVLYNTTMQPSLFAGDRFFVVSSALPKLFWELRQSDTALFKRGSIVLIDKRCGENQSRFMLVINSIVRFFTAQQISIFGPEEHLYIKRIIALPGDEVFMTNFILRIRPEGSDFTLTEFELSQRAYYPNIPQVPSIWTESLPFSGNMDRMLLGRGEYFVISDDRSNSGDSRTWGLVNIEEIIGRPVFRFWPLRRIGLP